MSATIDRANGTRLGDAELEEAVQNALARYNTLRIWPHALQITVANGVVTLNGHVRTDASKLMAEKLISQVPGVSQVSNNLYVDTDLEIAAAQALAHDPVAVKGFPGILVGSAFGDLVLKGSVASQEIKKAASEIVAKIAGVRGVANELVAPEPPKPAVAAKSPAKPAPKPAPKPVEDESEAAEE